MEYVNHPRYGNHPIPSGQSFSREEIERAHWRYAQLRYFAETAIVAQTQLQRFATYPRSLYVDIAETCEDCQCAFLFFAQEQQYWFETLRFWVDAHATRCPKCRRTRHHQKKLHQEYSVLVNKKMRSTTENTRLQELAQALVKLGYLHDAAKLQHLL